MRARAAAFGLLVLTVSLGLAPTTAAHADEDPDHWHAYVSLGDDSQTETVEAPDALTHRLEASLVVDTGDDGTRHIQVALPDGTHLLDFGPEDPSNGHESTVDIDGAAHARFTWDSGFGPDAGSVVHNVTLVAVRVVEVDEPIHVRWVGLDASNTSARLETPDGYTISSGRLLLPQNAHSTPGRRVWHQIDLPGPVLEFDVRTTYDGPDAAFAAPPNPIGGFLVVLGIALLSGGAWVLGKKAESRHRRQEAEDHPPLEAPEAGDGAHEDDGPTQS